MTFDDASQGPPVRRALISVSDKTGVIDYARTLTSLGVEILSTGGTARLLAENRISVTEVSDYTGFPEMMDGRVKTLHPKVHGGLLGRRGVDDEMMAQHGIQPIDLLVVNLYPFESAVARSDCELATAIENIDIGGPALLRAAAKNHAAVTVVVDPADYPQIIKELKAYQGTTSALTRFTLAVKAFEHTARYDGMIANYLGGLLEGHTRLLPRTLSLQFVKAQALRYGENPHQQAAFYTEPPNLQGGLRETSIACARQLQGKELSFNNIADADAALECVKSFDGTPACVIIKHANPCGVALGGNPLEAYDLAYATDPTSAFGGVIAFNQPLDAATARAVIERQFVEVMIAPEVSDEARSVLAGKQNVRVLACGKWGPERAPALDYRRVAGGLLVQDRDLGRVEAENLRVVTQRAPTDAELRDLLFAWKVVKYVKSNAIVYAKDRRTVGIGAGQMSRVDSARVALLKAADAKPSVRGAAMASDAFFPFRDSIDSAAEAGISAVIEPGGSMRDKEVIAAADEHDIAVLFTGMRHFRH